MTNKSARNSEETAEPLNEELKLKREIGILETKLKKAKGDPQAE